MKTTKTPRKWLKYAREYSFNYQRTPMGKARKLYRGMSYRVRKEPSYRGRKLLIDRADFFRWLFLDTDYMKKFRRWKKTNFKRDSAPSIDRIDNAGHYALNNIQLLTVVEHREKSAMER